MPARSAMCRYRGTSFSAAPALHTASETPRIALAPNLAVGKGGDRLFRWQYPAQWVPLPAQAWAHHSSDSAPRSSPAASHARNFLAKKREELHLFSVPSISSIRLSIFS